VPESVNVGFVGAGAVATRHARSILGFEGVRVAAVCDPSLEAARTLAADCGARAYVRHDEMIAAEALDGLYICVPPFAHGAPERAAIAADLPFFVEKPLAIDFETAEEIGAAVRDAGLTTAVGYHWRYLDTVERARRLLAGRPPRLVLGYWLDKVPPPAWWLRNDRSGGQTIEQTTHVLDLIRTLVGEAIEVYAASSRCERPDYPDADVPDVSSATIRFHGGAIGSVSSTSLLRAKHRAGIEVFADGLAIALSETDMAIDEGTGADRRAAAEDAKTRADRDFLEAVAGRGNGAIRAPYEDALETHRLACALTRSALEGRPIALAEARCV
jgi:predicted dehydrogenase